MQSKQLMLSLVALVVVSALSFYLGMKYQANKVPSTRGQFMITKDLSQESRGQFPERPQTNGFRPVGGTILSFDEKSITVKLSDGSSKIVFISENSSINKTEEATASDLVVGEDVMVFGQENSDGSITATNIQLNRGEFMQPGEAIQQ